ncbi:hypothetical protein M1P97_09055 [Parabacteroides sp. GYB001]|uniref:hypothetical protein n=1 Tax=Parabacteroides leei TaxID=2939491 RepID=UPI0020174628|nr:hypothetical protein [Parabacteroides leei]MCL3851432.1 hypothetical protein [Parabacteroides leei]
MDLGVKAKYDFSDLKKARKQLQNEVTNSMRVAGDLYLNVAVAKGSYQNRTGNLRSSNAYAITNDGKIIEEKVANTFSKTDAQKYALQAIQNANKAGDSLILVNGMPYASFVEKKGFDVSSMAYQQAADKLGAKE